MSVTRRGQGVFPWMKGAALAAVTVLAAVSTGFYPTVLIPLLALTTGALVLFAPAIAAIAFVVILAIPIAASNVIVGLAFLVVGVAAVQYLGHDGAKVFVALCVTFLAAGAGVEWAVVIAAGYILGATEGAIAALVACMVIQAAGALTGAPAIGVTATGGSADIAALLRFPVQVDRPLAFGWFLEGLRGIEVARFTESLSGVRNVMLLVAQPLLWAVGAAAAGSLKRPAEDSRRPVVGVLAGVVGVAVVFVACAVAMKVFGGPVGLGRMAVAALASGAIAVGVIAVWEWVFPPQVVPTSAARPGTTAADDADVDELLRLIADAEEELASKHTVQTVVMITDMKAFSKMTEEDGSVVTAKMIQRHRDLLLPVIEKYRGHGKSTGGDGLVAAFETPTDALGCAVEMQRTLTEFNAGRPGERDILIRIGVADGEVILDRGGRPFIGVALNTAARVMNLGDGGQVMTTATIMDKAGRHTFTSGSVGTFELKNIAEPVEVFELLWAPGQQVRPPAVLDEE